MTGYELLRLEDAIKQAVQQLHNAVETVIKLREKLADHPDWLELLGAAEGQIMRAEVKLTEIRQQVATTVGDDEQPAVEVEDGRA